jgi:hypothetical protein
MSTIHHNNTWYIDLLVGWRVGGSEGIVVMDDRLVDDRRRLKEYRIRVLYRLDIFITSEDLGVGAANTLNTECSLFVH